MKTESFGQGVRKEYLLDGSKALLLSTHNSFVR